MARMIRVNAEWIDAWLIKNNITQKDFSKMLGKSVSWWSVVKIQGGNRITVNTAMDMCRLCGLRWEDITNEEKAEEPQMIVPKDDVQQFIEILQRIDKRLEDIENRIEKLEWLSR